MCMACCKGCGYPINTDDNPEAYYMETPRGKEIELDNPLCESCKEDLFARMEDIHDNNH